MGFLARSEESADASASFRDARGFGLAVRASETSTVSRGSAWLASTVPAKIVEPVGTSEAQLKLEEQPSKPATEGSRPSLGGSIGARDGRAADETASSSFASHATLSFRPSHGDCDDVH